MRRFFQALVLLAALVVAGAVGAAGYFWWDLRRRTAIPPGGVIVEVRPGSSMRAIAGELRRLNLVRHELPVVLWARWKKLDRTIQSGEHLVEHSASPLEILERLRKPPLPAAQWVTIPEGFTAAQIAVVLERAGLGGRDLFRCTMEDPRVLGELDLPATGVEGYLFPDTYAFGLATEPEEVIRSMVRRFREESARLDERRRAAGMTEHEMVTLASIIEKETSRPEERPMIAGVFRNRLRIGMPLQSDPTVIYGIRDFDGNLRRDHLTGASPYNTYVIRGLPPGPIANPGRAALEAAVDPAETKALYFVSRNDGSHEFSNSLAEHNRAVWRYQKRRR